MAVKQEIITFLSLTSLVTLPWWLVVGFTSLSSEYVTMIMWSPALAGLATSYWYGLPISSFGWQWGRWKWISVSYVLPFLYTFIAYAFVWWSGIGRFGNPELIARVRKELAIEFLPSWVVLAWYFYLVATADFVSGTARALGEEIGWRGFLAPRMVAWLGFTKGSLLQGFLWSLWHVLLMIGSDYNAGTNFWYQFLCLTVLVTSTTVTMAWLRLQSGTLWTAAIMHSSHNLVIQKVFGPLTTQGPITPWAIDEFGFVLPIVCSCFAWYFWSRRSELSGTLLH